MTVDKVINDIIYILEEYYPLISDNDVSILSSKKIISSIIKNDNTNICILHNQTYFNGSELPCFIIIGKINNIKVQFLGNDFIDFEKDTIYVYIGNNVQFKISTEGIIKNQLKK